MLGSTTKLAQDYFKKLEHHAQVARQILTDYSGGGDKKPSLMECSREAMSFLRASITAVVEFSSLSAPGSKSFIVYLVIDRFDIILLHDTALLTPLMRLVQDPELKAVVKILVVRERKESDQEGGEGVAEFIEDHQDKNS